MLYTQRNVFLWTITWETPILKYYRYICVLIILLKCSYYSTRKRAQPSENYVIKIDNQYRQTKLKRYLFSQFKLIQTPALFYCFKE